MNMEGNTIGSEAENVKRTCAEGVQELRARCKCNMNELFDKFTLKMLDGLESLKAKDKRVRAGPDFLAVCINVIEVDKYEVIWRAEHPLNIAGPCISSQATAVNSYLSGIIAAIVAAATMKVPKLFIHINDDKVREQLTEDRVDEEERKLYRKVDEVLMNTGVTIRLMNCEEKDEIENSSGRTWNFYE